MTRFLRILLIEDNPGDVELIEDMLHDAGIMSELKCVDRLSSGIVELKENEFDVILLDLGLPDSSGLETLTRLNDTDPSPPVIVFTGLSNEAVGSAAVMAGAQDYLVKGQIEKNLLSRSINHAIERKQSTVAIQAALSEWSACFDAMSDGVSIHAVDGTILNANKTLFELLGKSPEEVIGRKCHQVFHGDVQFIAECPMSETTKTSQRSYTERFEPGLDRWLALSTSPIPDGSGCLTRIVHTVRDITGRKSLEEQFRQSQKMESIGTLAGGIAHDFNNILTAITGYGQMALMKMADDDPMRLYIQPMLEASYRAVHLTKDLLLFSRKQTSDKRAVDLNQIVARVEKFLIKVIGEDIAYRTVLYTEPITIMADEHQLEQVLMNLATNAGHSMPKGGALTVTTEITSLEREFVSAHGFGKPGLYALLSVTDSGEGMDETTQKRIFEPFFTTKEVGKGTGLGLSVVYGIIREHGGYIDVGSEKGAGTTFRIYLPVIKAGLEEPFSTVPEEEPTGGSEMILLAEDDEMVRRLEVGVLTGYGYKVIEARDGEEAVKLFRENSERIDLLLFDLVMPKMNGKEAFDEIRRIQPNIRAIFSSGYAPETIQKKMVLETGVQMLPKPTSTQTLLRKVRSVLDGE